MNRFLAPVALTAVTLSAAACGSSSPPPAAAAPASAAPASAKPAPCKLKTTFDYLERDDDPGASVMASEVGNVDFDFYGKCVTTLASFKATAGQAPGECMTIALASSNPGYDVNAVPAPPLKGVIESAGPGC